MYKFFYAIALLTMSSYSMASQQELFKEINGITAYNATILGYSIACKFPVDQTELIKNQMVTSINHLNLSDKEYQFVQDTFRKNLDIAKERGPSNSKLNCDQFKVEFNKIYQAILTAKNK
jgi:hypothetical protein